MSVSENYELITVVMTLTSFALAPIQILMKPAGKHCKDDCLQPESLQPQGIFRHRVGLLCKPLQAGNTVLYLRADAGPGLQDRPCLPQAGGFGQCECLHGVQLIKKSCNDACLVL